MPGQDEARAALVAALDEQNRGRDGERLAMKYAKMAQSPFVFLRGACHLFYAALPATPLFHAAPPVWSCGDLHFENFGSYKGDNRLVYFDINDFDEAALAPASWDVLRLLSSIECGADELRIGADEAAAASRRCLDAYRAALAGGKPLWVERETSSGLVNELLAGLQGRARAAFLDKRTQSKGQRRRLKLDGVKALPASAAQRETVTAFMRDFAAGQAAPGFFKVLDIGRRIAGTGSLGIERFVILVEGKGSPDGNYLLDLKAARPSALTPSLAALGLRQPTWTSEAARVAGVQRYMQAVDLAWLQAVAMEGRPYILKALQPAEDRVAIGEWGRKVERLHEVVACLGRILAWDQLRASGRGGAACADELIAFARRTDWTDEMLATAGAMSRTTRQQWALFVAARQAGELAGGDAA